MLQGKKILVGLSGGIAAYKTPELIRLLIKEGAQVRVIATKNALQFITRVTLETVSQNKLYSDVFESVNAYSTNHISHADWADVMIVAPATANIIGKFASGIADDALSTTFLGFDKPVFIAPAMNTKMLHHPSVIHNIKFLSHNNVRFIDSNYGDLACGVKGDGRMKEPEEIVEYVNDFFKNSMQFAGKKVLITAGPTYEAIDAVRFIGNYSSGKMGVALAVKMAERGANVTLVTGPISLDICHDNITVYRVVSANDMYEACIKEFANADITIMAAAVADYTIEEPAVNKLKKTAQQLSLTLVPTKDILKSMGEKKTAQQLLVGFALETDNEEINAKQKMKDKNLDIIVLNSLKEEGAGFNHATNKVAIINNKETKMFPLKDKLLVAADIIDEIALLAK